jgi:gluconolactonase
MAAQGERFMKNATPFATTLGFIEGPVWDDDAQTLSVVSIDHGCIYILDRHGAKLEQIKVGGGPNGLVRAKGGLLVAQNGGIFGGSGPVQPGVQRIVNGHVDYVIDRGFFAPNDLAFGPDGRLYVTDPATDRAVLEQIEGRLLACDFATGECEVIADGRSCPNGLAFEADGQHLLLAQTFARIVERFSRSADGWASEGTFCRLVNGRPDGMALDIEGNLWVCTPGTGGIEIFSKSGEPLRRIELGAGTMTTNICFGGADLCDVFVTAAGIGTVLTFRSDAAGLPLLC